jgi:hypothetical protein
MNWDQIQAILWLRWRLTKNQFARGGPINAVLSIIILGLVLIAALGIGLGAVFLGASALGKHARGAALAWDGLSLCSYVLLAGLRPISDRKH